jgi:hypothetical protein
MPDRRRDDTAAIRYVPISPTVQRTTSRCFSWMGGGGDIQTEEAGLYMQCCESGRGLSESGSYTENVQSKKMSNFMCL